MLPFDGNHECVYKKERHDFGEKKVKACPAEKGPVLDRYYNPGAIGHVQIPTFDRNLHVLDLELNYAKHKMTYFLEKS